MEIVVQSMGLYLNNNGGHLKDIIFQYKCQNILFRLQLTRHFYFSYFFVIHFQMCEVSFLTSFVAQC